MDGIKERLENMGVNIEKCEDGIQLKKGNLSVELYKDERIYIENLLGFQTQKKKRGKAILIKGVKQEEVICPECKNKVFSEEKEEKENESSRVSNWSEEVRDKVDTAFETIDKPLTVPDLVEEVKAYHRDEDIDITEQTLETYVYNEIRRLKEDEDIEKLLVKNGKNAYMKTEEVEE